ncbi:hypothetical protein [Streptomyces sporangiiformans]|uniref:hypothetical protein n=1 Tax=Streptomyces sporangiiformans TaxID=2315329 RepID=UPI0013C49287|nr:hypothetical protein [Streptomyces sporangiiformans]
MSGTRNPARAVPQGAHTLTPEGAAWLARAIRHPCGRLAALEDPPGTPAVLPCGHAFDVVNAPVIFGRRMLDRLWDEGPGSGPVATHRGRILLFATPGTAQRLPALLRWEEWGSDGGAGRSGAIPPLLCHGQGDAVTIPTLSPAPALAPGPAPAEAEPRPSEPEPVPPPTTARWLVAPDTLRPWLPGPEVLLWAAVRAARPARISIFPPAEQGAKVYDVSRRR